MAFHINENHEVKPCKATKRCRFGGATGRENHFASRTEAETFAQEELRRTYGGEGGTTRRGPSLQGIGALRTLEREGMAVTRVPSLVGAPLSPPQEGISSIDLVEEGRPSPSFLEEIRSGHHSFAL